LFAVKVSKSALCEFTNAMLLHQQKMTANTDRAAVSLEAGHP
jgi:hypothetical protein